MKRCMSMPFGAEFDGDDVRFRLWAPAAREVELYLGDGRNLPMTVLEDGFFECRGSGATVGTRYGFRVDGRDPVVPDPASRRNPEGVHALSEVVDPRRYEWQDEGWNGRPWNEAVLYELHVGTFSAAGDFDGVAERLDYLAGLGVTAVELMPVAEFPGRRGWGYDGVLPFAPESAYGSPQALKRLVDRAHDRGLMVFLDVVYNHFGPEGNYLHLYAPQFFTDRVETPWGQAIDFDGPDSRAVRDFFICNALYWLREYHLDGLRIDAVHAIFDRTRPDIVEELAERVRGELPADRHVHLILENHDNASHYLRPETIGGAPCTAQWNDDFHHPLHVLLTGETHGYYRDYADDPLRHVARCLAEGFAFQGEISACQGRPRGEPSADLPSSAFVTFLQTHDQVGNRALGERISALAPQRALAAARALWLLAPQPPMLFMGEEFDATSPFPFFCNYEGDLAQAVTEGRRREFRNFPQFSDPAMRERIPDPNRHETFDSARLDWSECRRPAQRATQELYRQLLSLRHDLLVPRLPAREGQAARSADGAVNACWWLASGERWRLLANLGDGQTRHDAPTGRRVFISPDAVAADDRVSLPPWTVAVYLEPCNGD